MRRGALSFHLGAALQATGQGNQNVQLAPVRRAAAARGLRPQADLVSLCKFLPHSWPPAWGALESPLERWPRILSLVVG